MQKQDAPVTVFTTFYRPDRHLDEAIRSVLAQTYSNFEYLLINDGAAADGEKLLKTYNDPRIRLINNNPKRGRVHSRIQGLEEARGKYFAVLDSDDIAEPNRLEKQVAFLDAHPSVVLVGSSLKIIDEQSQVLARRNYPLSNEEIKKALPVYNCIAQSTVLCRTDAMLKAGSYDADRFHFAEDYDLWLRMGRLGEFHNFAEPLARYRIHPGAGKYTLTKLAIKDTIRVRILATRSYGYSRSLRFYLSVAFQAALLILPASWIYRLFTILAYRRSPMNLQSS
ncbi:MAG: glycosyltransferase [Bdellovibrionota bacterium]